MSRSPLNDFENDPRQDMIEYIQELIK